MTPALRLDTANECVWRGTRAIPLTPKTFAVLRYLVEHPGRLVTKEELLNAAWPDIYVSDAALKVCIRRIRQALGDQPHASRFIETVHWRGYRFIGKISETHEAVRSPESRVRSLEKSGVQSPQPESQEDKPCIEHSASAPQSAIRNPQSAIGIVGREGELAQLQRRLEQALRGERQIVFVTGELGIGKTTVVEAFLERVAADRGLWIARGQCVAHHGAGEAYLPVLEALDRLCRTPGHERLPLLLSQHAQMWLAQMPSLMSPADHKRLWRELQGATRERMLREMATVVDALAAETPLVLVLEDLHWSDYATLDLLSFLARRWEPARLLLIGTYRPVEVLSREHPLRGVKQELQMHGQCAELPLECLTEAAVAEYLAVRFPAGVHVPLQALARVIHQRTDGNPLFMVNVVDYLVAQGFIEQTNGRWELQGGLDAIQIGVPASIQQMIETQIDRLSQEEQRVLEAASVAGMEFSAAAVAAGLAAEVVEVEERCEGLTRRAQFLRSRGVSEWPDGTVAARYSFIHSLYQQAWYERVPAGRRVHLHRRIGEREEVAYGNRAGEIAAELAVHFERGRDYGRAVPYRRHAAKNALRRCGYREAIGHLTTGLELLQALPATPERLQQEITLQIPLGVSLVATKGYAAPEVEKIYTRALELCRQVEATPQLCWALWGLQGFYFVRAQLQTARELGEQLLSLAQRLQDPELLGVAHYVLGPVLCSLGELALARTHLEQGIALCDSRKHRRLRVACLSFMARVLWALGYLDQARQMTQEALALAQELAHPFTSVVTLGIATLLHVARREAPATQERAQAVMTLAAEQGFVDWRAQATVLRGWALAEQGHGEEGIAQIRQGLTAYQATGAELGRPLFLGLLADAYGKTGRAEEGLTAVTEALAAAHKNGQRLWEAWLYRLKGELTLQQFKVQGSRFKVQGSQHPTPSTQHPAPNTQAEAEAEAYFQQAIDLTRRQSAKSLELRAVMSLSRLWQHQGKKKEARRMLAEIYGWFSEGFDTADLREAKVLLEELS